MEPFNPCKHGQYLVGPANSWNQIQGKWDDHPVFEEASQRLYEDGCCGAAAHVNEFIRTLLEMIEDNAIVEQPSDYEQFMAEQPLWSLAMHAGDTTPGTPRDAFAAELQVITDWLVPEDDRMALQPKAQAGEYHRWCERQRLRSLLLAEIEKAEKSDET